MIERPERARQIRDLLADIPAGAFLGPAYRLFVVHAGATANGQPYAINRSGLCAVRPQLDNQ